MIASQPVISVIVPHLNQTEPLRRCLRSLERQTYSAERFEVIVVDNGSKVLPTAIVGGLPNARLEQETRPGPGPARNRGVAGARGRILAFIDADCIAGEGWLASIAAALGDGSIKRVIGGDVRIAVVNPERFTELEAYESIFAYRQEEYIRKFGFAGTGNLAVRREDFDVIGPFAGIEVAEDTDWGRRARALGYETEYLPEMIVYHPARPTFLQLYAKWNRHIDHAFTNFSGMRFGRARWILYAIAVALSPILDLRRILTSARVPTMRDRWFAAAALARIRLYRARRMIVRVMKPDSNRGSQSWNRD